MSANCQVHEASHSTEVGNSFHVFNLLRGLWRHVLGEVDVGIKRGGDRVSIGFVKMFQDVMNVLLLGEEHFMVWAVSSDLDSNEIGETAQIPHLETFLEFSLD